MKSFIALACLSSALLVSAPAAQAAAVTYTFSVSGVGGSGTGSFVFDDTSGFVNAFNETEFLLSEFRFSFGGDDLTQDVLDKPSRSVLFDPTGKLLGLEAFSSSRGFSFLPSVGDDAAYFMTARGSSDVSFRLDQNVVSEPGAALLGVAALGGLVAWRRRRSD